MALEATSALILGTTPLNYWVSSRDDTQAKLFVQDCIEWAGIMNTVVKPYGISFLDDEKKQPKFEVRLPLGCINSMSSNPNAQAGKRGGRILDEFALHCNQAQLWGITQPGILWGGTLAVASSQRGTETFFNQRIREITEGGNPRGYYYQCTTMQDALEDGLLGRLKARWPKHDPRQLMDEAAFYDSLRLDCPDLELFNQEFNCVASDDATAFVPLAYIEACQYPEWTKEAWAHSPSDLWRANNLYIGVDIGRRHDLTVIWVCEQVGDVLETRAKIELEKVPFRAQEEILHEWLRLKGVRRCCIDETGMGMMLAENAEADFGSKVEPVNFAGKDIKAGMAYEAYHRLEQQRCKIPGDLRTVGDFRSVRKIVTGDKIRFAGERSKNGHSDRWWAFCLACLAAKEEHRISMPMPFGKTGYGKTKPRVASIYSQEVVA